MEKAADLELLQGLWKMYLRQKSAEEDVGIDTNHNVARMREVFKLAAKLELTDEEIEKRFPDEDPVYKAGECPRCQNTGKFFSADAEFRFRGAEDRYRAKRAPGVELCECFEGRRLREVIKKGPQQKKKGYNT